MNPISNRPKNLFHAGVVFLAFFAAFHVNGQTLYSRGAAGAALSWNNILSWSTSSHADAVGCACIPTAGSNVVIGRNHVMTVPNGVAAVAASVIVNDDASASPSLTVGNAVAASSTLTIGGDMTINSGGTFTLGGTANANNNLTVVNVVVNGTGIFNHGNTGDGTNAISASGNITINGTGIFRTNGNGGAINNLLLSGNLTNANIFNYANTADASTVTFNSGTAKTISGAGATYTFSNLTMNTGAAANVNVNSNILINGALTFSASGLLVVNSSSNITLAAAATIAGNTNARYIQLDESNGSNGSLIRVNNNTVAAWQFFFPVGTATGGYNPLDLTTGGGSTMATAPANNSTLTVKAIINPSVQGRLKRIFRLTVSGNGNATTFTAADFYYTAASDVSTGDVQANYTTGWYLNTSTGAYTVVTGTAPGATFFTSPATAQSLATGIYYYTIGTSTAYPSTWYSYQSGVWSDYNIWTLDPSGTTLVNPLTQPPLPGDEVVILNGFTVTVDLSNITLSSTTIESGAVLDMSTFTGHNLGTVDGSGLLRINGTALPLGTYTSFVSLIGGTIEYYDTGGNLLTTQTTYHNLLLSNSANAAITFVTASNLAVSGTLDITQTAGTGSVTWQINDASNTQRTISILGDVTVSTSGLITVGTGNSGAATPHNVTLRGDFTNSGTVKFFDPTDATYSSANYTSGAVYTSATRGNTTNVTFAGVISRTVTCNGTTDFYRLTVDKGTGQQAILTVNSSAAANMRLFGPSNLASSGTAPDNFSNNALSLLNGTLQLTGTLTIPLLCANGAAAAGADYFAIPENAALWINSASVNVTVANALTTNDDQRIIVNGLLRVTNGTITSGYGRGLGSGSGGTFLVEGGTINMWQYRPLFGGTNIFVYIQTGGTVNVGTTGYNGTPVLAGVTDAITAQYARFSLPTTTSTFQMSGGTLNIGTPSQNSTLAGAQGIDIQSSASNFNVTGGTINAYIPTSGFNFGINSTAPFGALNIYKEGAGAFTATLNQALTVLNSCSLITGNTPTLSCGNNNLTVGGNLDVQANTTLTPGTNTITLNGSGAQSWLNNGTITSLNNVVVNKSAGTLTLGGANVFPNIVGLTLTSGTMADGGKTITVTTTLSNSAIHSGAGAIVHSAAGASAIGGTGGVFGNLTISTDATVTNSGNQSITGNLRLLNNNSTLAIGSSTLSVTGGIFSDAGVGVAFTGTKRVQTNGLRNDGGLTRKATSGVDLLFPVGTTSILYTPITINANATTAGTITVQPVNGAHPNVSSASHSVRFFWRVTSAGFAGLTTVTHKNYTFSTAILDPTVTIYTPARYDPSTFTWSYRTATYDATATTVIPNFNTGTAWTGSATDKLDGEYTAGNIVSFGGVTVYYSRASGAWNTPATWSNVAVGGTAAGSFPCSTCPVVIGDGASNNHDVSIDANFRTCGSLFLGAGSSVDCGTFSGLNFGVNTTGTGKLRIGQPSFPAGDFVNFLSLGGGTVEWYGATYVIPSTGAAPQLINLNKYNNLIISPNTGAQITLPGLNFTVYGDMTVSGVGTGQVYSNFGGTFTVTVNGNLNVNSGTFSFRNNTRTTVVLAGTTSVVAGATVSVQGGGTQTHLVTTSGNIINNGTLTLRNGTEVVNLTFSGTANTTLTGTTLAASTTLNTITVNKGTSMAPTITIGPLAGAVSTLSNNWLTLQNGTINFNVSASTFIITNTATNPFTIPSTCSLKAQSGIVNISNVAANDSDLILNGKLEVAGATVNIGASGNNNNNDIEYASAGLPSIVVSSGTLYVNGAIRRSTSVLSGALVYNQSAGFATVGGRNCSVAPSNTRGVFEIENNSGSSFIMTGGTLTISRPTGGTNFSDLYLNPASSSVSAGSTIQIGDNALGTQTVDINITPSVGSLTILGAAANGQTVNMVSSPLSTSGVLTINTASTLNTNSLDVGVGGNMTVNGTYNGTIGSGNTTTFTGTGAQTASLSATSTFLNMTVNKPSGTVTLAGTAPTITDLNILSGILDVVNLNLVVIGNITNNSTQLNSGTGSISLAGTAAVISHIITSNGGIFGKLSLAGSAATKNVNVSGDMTITNRLDFATTNRFLNIGSSQLTFSSAADVFGAGATAFIRTNGVSSDLGVVKNWPVAGATLFTYPLGTLSNYTPVAVTLAVTTAGTLTIIPVNERHPTYNVGSSERILNYYWIITRDNTLAYSTTGSHIYSYPSALIGGTGGTLAAGYLDLSNPTGWITGSAGSSATTTTMTFSNSLASNLPTVNNTFHYSVGTANTLPNPIIPVYSRLDDAGVAAPGTGGSWTAASSWTTSSTGHGAALGAAPTGVPVVILSGARINMNANGRIAFTSRIDGLLVLATSFGHNLGIMRGTGTMRTGTNTFPAGNYTIFVSSLGGTIEYVAPMTLNNRTTYNNLLFSGAGTATMTASDLTLNGSMTIPAGVTVNNASNRNLTLARDWSNSGTFTPGTGTVTFNGSLAQSIIGTTSFYNLTVSKSNNLNLTGATTVNHTLTLTTGNVISTAYPAASLLTLPSAATIAGGSATSFISGQISKTIASGTTLTFPLGSTAVSRYRPIIIGGTGGPASDVWTVSYIGNNPTTDGFNNFTFNSANMRKVSMYEYWQVACSSGTATASLTLSFGPGSYSGADIGGLGALKTARWTGAQWDLPPGGGTFSQTGDNVNGTVTVSFQNAFSPQTLATDDPTSTLPIELLNFEANLVGSVVKLNWATASEINNDFFTIERSTDLEQFENVAVVKGQGTKITKTNYETVDEYPLAGRSYYRLKQTDYNGVHTYSDVRMIDNSAAKGQLKLYPNPVTDHHFTLEANYLHPSEEVTVRVVNMQGVSVFEATYRVDESGYMKRFVELNPMSNGLYAVIIISSSGLKKRVVLE